MSAPCCPYCDRKADLVGGAAIYPSRPDLFGLKFWRCAPCDAYVGCHKTGAWVWRGAKKVASDGTLPLGRLANAALRKAKSAAHAAFDPLWKSGGMTRREAYAWLADALGISPDNCHIGMMDLDACRAVVAVVKNVRGQA
jgi:hypothetical protein